MADDANNVTKKVIEGNEVPGHIEDLTALLDTTGLIPGLAPDLL